MTIFLGGGEREEVLYLCLNWQKVVFCIIFRFGVCCQYLSRGVLMFVMNILWF